MKISYFAARTSTFQTRPRPQSATRRVLSEALRASRPLRKLAEGMSRTLVGVGGKMGSGDRFCRWSRSRGWSRRLGSSCRLRNRRCRVLVRRCRGERGSREW